MSDVFFPIAMLKHLAEIARKTTDSVLSEYKDDQVLPIAKQSFKEGSELVIDCLIKLHDKIIENHEFMTKNVDKPTNLN